jgi:hypothetical protein
MKPLLTLILILSGITVFGQNQGDTIVIPTFNYSQTYGIPWDGTIRDTIINFPEIQGVTYSKILMAYNIRCKDGNVSTPQNTNLGCGEWDYSCNTYITDSSRVDSVINFINSHTITNFQGQVFYYVDYPLYNFYQYLQKDVVIDNTISENLCTIGNGSLPLENVISTDNHSGKTQILYTKNELETAGVTPGNIDAIILTSFSEQATAGFLKVKIKPTNKTELNSENPDFDAVFSGFKEVYFHDYTFVNGANRIQFYSPFVWDGTSNILIEISFTNKNTSAPLSLKGEDVGFASCIYTENGYNLNALNGNIEISPDAFENVSNELTVSFWSNGNNEILPAKTSVVYGVDGANRRQLNLHLPWADSKIYYDCGNNGSGYDRIAKLASPEEYKGNWNHWALTKNASTGEMKVYLNGQLWKEGTGKNKLITLTKVFLAGNNAGSLFYSGKIKEFRFWNKALDEQTIKDWMYKPVDNSHPYYANLLAYYKLDENSGTTVFDSSPYGGQGNISGYLYWNYLYGDDLFNGFEQTTTRPNITFAQGEYELTINDETVTDSVMLTPSIVREYKIIPHYDTLQDDSIAEISVNEYWQAKNEYIYNPDGIITDSIIIEPADTIYVTQLSYYKRYPSKIELMSFVTPYGIYLDLGENGKTWYFDVTDYAPVLKGRKRMTVERGGQWQEDMDIKFLYIVGTPPRDVIDIRQIWRVQYKSYSAIQQNKAYETRDVMMSPDGKYFKLRAVITGHGQQGEFIKRHHIININGGEPEFDWFVWDECSTIPVYPQGGTWIYDRAGWCPGNPTVIYDYDITDMVTPGETASVDYDIPVASGTSNYIVNIQLMTYGEANFQNDAAVVKVLKPNATEASEMRFNPACSYPEIIIQNTGTNPLTSLTIEYHADAITQSFEWTGNLNFMETETVTLPVDDLAFWQSSSGKFYVEIHNQNDENEYNNSICVPFENVDVYPEGNPITVKLWTNNRGWQTSYTLSKSDGTVIYEKSDCENSTLYEDEFNLEPGCYNLQINDAAGDGLEFWANPGQGVGSFKIVDSDGNILYNFDPDFGSFAIHEFGIGNITGVDKKTTPFTVFIFPNPVQNVIKIDIKGFKINTDVTLTVSNLMMMPLITKRVSSRQKNFTTELDLSRLPQGGYLLKVDYGKYSKILKLIKTN